MKELANFNAEEHIIKLGERIRKLRDDNDMTQLNLAVKVEIDPTALRRYEKGKVEMGFTTLVKFAEVFEVSVDELLGIEINESQ